MECRTLNSILLFSHVALWTIARAEERAHNMINRHHTDRRDLKMGTQAAEESCSRPCQCSMRKMHCKLGVNIIKDGCDCCFMCARQQGDACSHKHRCDRKKGLFCDRKSRRGKDKDAGICRARSAKDCQYNGKVYKDGQTFHRSCREQCTCQNGQYGCADLCAHELTPPSPVHCPNAQLIQIKDRCCKDWVCPIDTQTVESELPIEKGACSVDESSWSACSVSCGMGVSIRISNDNPECAPQEESRLCMIRPCHQHPRLSAGKPCRSIWRPPKKTKLRYKDCDSMKEYSPRYCTTCLTDKCCVPEMTKNRNITFHCKKDKTIKSYSVLWILSCQCLDHCPSNWS